MSPRGRELVENEEGSEGESKTGFVDLDQDSLLNVLGRVDMATLGRAACVNKLWRNVARDDRLWEPIVLRLRASSGGLESFDALRVIICDLGMSFRRFAHGYMYLGARMSTPSDFNSTPDFYSIDPQVFSRKIRPWVQK